MRALNRIETVVALGGLSTYNDSLRQRIEAGEVGQIGYNWHSEPDLEVLLVRQPDITFLTVDAPYNAKALGRSRDLGMIAVPMFDWAERHYLGRAEWIKYLSLFFNAERDASVLFETVSSRVTELKALAATNMDTPTVLWGLSWR